MGNSQSSRRRVRHAVQKQHAAVPPLSALQPQNPPNQIVATIEKPYTVLDSTDVPYYDKLSFLVNAILINQLGTGLTRLPDHVLVDIMTLLSPEDMTKLRHVSRQFMRLFDQHPRFKKYHATATWEPLQSAPWAVPDPSVFYPGQATSSWRPLCRTCDEVRHTDLLGTQLLASMPLLYCSGCRKHHRTMHFSANQRATMEDEQRVCIGHEACLFVDRRVFFSWRQVVAAARCPSATDRVLPYTELSLSCKQSSCTFKPELRASFTSLDTGKIQMKFTRTFHLKLKCLENGKIDAVSLEKIGGSFRDFGSQREPLDKLCFDTQDLRRAFDPHVCSCVDWGESKWRWTTLQGRDFTWELAPRRANGHRRCLTHGYKGTQGRCLGQLHGFSAESAVGKYEVDIFHCADSRDMLVVQAVMTSIVETASDPAWLCNLDFESCQYTADDQMRGITWCADLDCGVARAHDHYQSLFELEWKHNL